MEVPSPRTPARTPRSLGNPSRRRVRRRGLGILLGLALLPSCGEQRPQPGSAEGRGSVRPNLLLISLDSVRADHISSAGYRSPHAPGVPTTPSIDRLAAEGVFFEGARASSSWTLPSHVALLTGRPDLVHAVELDAHRIGAGTPTLAERLQGTGFRTAGFFSGPYLEPRFGFDHGFSLYRACYGPDLEAASSAYAAAHRERMRLMDSLGSVAFSAAWRKEAEAQRALEVASQLDRSSEVVAEAVIAELERDAEGSAPFFVFAHFFDAHYDYAPPAPFDSLFDPEYRGAIDGHDFYRNPAVATFDVESPSGRRRQVSDRDLEHLLALYDGEIASTDAALGRILGALDRLGLSENTLVVVVADHGDEFFEHGAIGHRRTLSREVLDVPLVLRLPGSLPAGRRITAPVATSDLTAALLELLHVPASDLDRGTITPRLLGEETEPSGILSRLVSKRPARVRVEEGGRARRVDVDSVRVQESFRRGPLEILRERSWILPPSGLDPTLLEALRTESERRRTRETLRWIDLERFPAEREEDFASDFSDPRAAATLEAFRKEYRRLGILRAESLSRAREGEEDHDESAAQRIALGALGYGGTPVGEHADLESLLLPLPGDGG